jgi:hypothetical protein
MPPRFYCAVTLAARRRYRPELRPSLMSQFDLWQARYF